jgi:hypothetical protein
MGVVLVSRARLLWCVLQPSSVLQVPVAVEPAWLAVLQLGGRRGEAAVGVRVPIG